MAFYGADPVSSESVSKVTATPSFGLGTRRFHNNEEYIYCYNNTGSSVTQGALMVASALSGYSLTRSSTAAADFPLCAVKNADVAAGSYFWGLVRGTYNALSATVAAGALIGPGADGAIQTALVGSFPTGPVIGKCLIVGSGSTKPLVMVRLFG